MVVDVLHPGKATVSKADVSSSNLYCQLLVVLFLMQKSEVHYPLASIQGTKSYLLFAGEGEAG